MNRKDEFIRLFAIDGWLVIPDDVVAKLNLYNQINKEIKWE